MELNGIAALWPRALPLHLTAAQFAGLITYAAGRMWGARWDVSRPAILHAQDRSLVLVVVGVFLTAVAAGFVGTPQRLSIESGATPWKAFTVPTASTSGH